MAQHRSSNSKSQQTAKIFAIYHSEIRCFILSFTLGIFQFCIDISSAVCFLFTFHSIIWLLLYHLFIHLSCMYVSFWSTSYSAMKQIHKPNLKIPLANKTLQPPQLKGWGTFRPRALGRSFRTFKPQYNSLILILKVTQYLVKVVENT